MMVDMNTRLLYHASTMTKTNSRKALNDGTCQICSSRQRLPNGKMAKHGYTVEYHYFNGTCPGSDELPYQQSRDLIPAVIDAYNRVIAGLKETIEKNLKPATEPIAWYRAYIADERGKSSYTWVRVTMTRTGESDVVATFTNPYTKAEEKAKHLRFYVRSDVALLEKATEMNADFADYKKIDLRLVTAFRDDMQRRYDTWSLKPLLPVLNEDAEVIRKSQAEKDAKAAEREAKRVEKLTRAAERARKLVAKYEKLVPAEIRENLSQYESNSEEIRAVYETLYEKNYSVYSLLVDDLDRAHGRRVYNTDPRNIIAEYEALTKGGE